MAALVPAAVVNIKAFQPCPGTQLSGMPKRFRSEQTGFKLAPQTFKSAKQGLKSAQMALKSAQIRRSTQISPMFSTLVLKCAVLRRFFACLRLGVVPRSDLATGVERAFIFGLMAKWLFANCCWPPLLRYAMDTPWLSESWTECPLAADVATE
jgi:hypothetical protein